MSNFKAIGKLIMELLHLKDLGGYRKCRHECSFGVNLVIDNFVCSFRYFTSVSTSIVCDVVLLQSANKHIW